MSEVKKRAKQALFDEETENAIVKKYQDDMLIAHIAEGYYCHRHTIMRLLKRRGIEQDAKRRNGTYID